MQFGQTVGRSFQPLGRQGQELTVEFLVGFRAIESKVSGQIDDLLSCGKRIAANSAAAPMGQGEKEKLGVVLLQVFDRRDWKRKGKASAHEILGMRSSTAFPFREREVTV